MVSQNTLFTVIPFHHFHWVTAIFIRRPPRGVKRRQSDQPGQNQGLQKRGTTICARSHVFKHCSFKTTDFKLFETPTTELYACAVSFCVKGARFFFSADIEQLHKHTYMRQNPRLCKYPHKHSDLDLRRE